MEKILSIVHKFTGFVGKHKVLSFMVIVGVIIGGYFLFHNKANAAVKQYVLNPVTKGTIIVSVSGSGQVAASNQLDIKPKVSGTVTSLKVKEGDALKAGTTIASLDTKDIQQSVRDAQLGLETAELALKKLQQPSDELSLVQAQNAYAQAQRSLDKLQQPPDEYQVLQAQNAVTKAQRDLEQAQSDSTQQQLDTNQNLDNAYKDAYTTISNTFLDTPNMVHDLLSVKVSDTDQSDNIWSYKNILGQNATVIDTFLTDYDSSTSLFYKTFDDFKKLTRESDHQTIYNFLDTSITTTEAVSKALEDARNMLDLIADQDYKSFYIAPIIDNLRPRIQTDISTINKDLTALRAAKDTIDNANQKDPDSQQKAADAITAAEEALQEKQKFLADLLAPAKPEDIATAKETVQEKQAALNKLKQGPDALDVQNQELAIQEKKNALADAQSKLSDYIITAPFDGTLATLNIQNNDTVSQSTAVGTFVTNQFIAEISLNEVDVAKIAVGNKATLAFDAIPDLSITGQVLQIDLLGTVSQGVVSYTVKVGFDTQDPRVKPGMTANASIVTEVHQDVLVVPNSALKSQNDVHYVQTVNIPPSQKANQDSTGAITVTTNEQPQQKEVEVGAANDTETEISSGLQEGDQIITQTTSLNSNTTSQTNSGFRLPGLGGGGGGGGGNRGGNAAFISR